jgi:hypothetical protein
MVTPQRWPFPPAVSGTPRPMIGREVTDYSPAAAPPADVVADLRRWREEVARILAQRGAPVAGRSADPAPSDAVAAHAAALLRCCASPKKRTRH